MSASLLQELLAIHPLEWMGVITGLLCVWLTVRAHVACWPVGIVSSAAYAWFFYAQLKLYSDALLQLFFIGTSLLGWWQWRHGGSARTELPITWLDARGRAAALVSTAVASSAVGWLFARFTDASLPWLDATTSGLSVTAQLLLVRKKVESWVLWIVVDVLSVGMYLAKQARLTALLYVVFLVLATRGFFSWKRSLSPASATG
jgi:nicotinamide mononucleotide transporter